MSIAYQYVLPDPNNPIGNAGQTTGTDGPGYRSVQLTSNSPIMKTRTNSGRTVARAVAGQRWDIDISYNPMTRAQFEPIYNFLLNRRGGLKPFQVSLPQYALPQNTTFSNYAVAAPTGIRTTIVAGQFIIGNSYKIDTAGNTTWTNAGAASSAVGTVFTAANAGAGTGVAIALSGTSSLLIDGLSGSSGDPSPGDLFTITDAGDVNHTKTYRVTQVETNSTYNTLQPTAAQRIVHFIPGLSRAVQNNSILVFANPLIRVVATDSQEYSLGANGLYNFSLKLEEAQP